MNIILPTKTVQFKIVFYGPALCGKTTNVNETFKRLTPEQRLSDKVREIETDTDKTLKYEFMPVRFNKVRGFVAEFSVYTVPGQVFYENSRKLLLKNTDGIIFVADSQQEKRQENIDSFKEMKRHLESNGLRLYEDVALTIQFNKQDLASAMDVDQMVADLCERDTPYYAASAANGEGVAETFTTIIKQTISNARRLQKKIG